MGFESAWKMILWLFSGCFGVLENPDDAFFRQHTKLSRYQKPSLSQMKPIMKASKEDINGRHIAAAAGYGRPNAVLLDPRNHHSWHQIMKGHQDEKSRAGG